MGKNPGPSPEELEFIFECFTRGLSDREVLDEMQDTEFPVRNPRFVRDRRKGFNAARKVLEIALKQQLDPAIAKARQKHLGEISHLINTYMISVRAPGIQYLPTWADEKGLELPFTEHEPYSGIPFYCVKEHLPFPILWQDYSFWLSKISEYFKTSNQLKQRISQDDCLRALLESGKIKERKEFIVERVFRSISDRVKEREPRVLNRVKECEPRVLNAQELESQIVTRYRWGQEATQLIAIFSELETLGTKIRQYLKEIQVRCDYINHTCRLCPGQKT
jgi:hypothetical protein